MWLAKVDSFNWGLWKVLWGNHQETPGNVSPLICYPVLTDFRLGERKKKQKRETMDDLRDWLGEVDRMGELRRIEGADWDLEIGCLTALNWKRRGGPALLFDKIKGYAEGFRVVSCCISAPSRVALTLGLPQGCSDREFLGALCQRLAQWEANLDKFAPKVVKSGPVLENIQSGDDVDLFRFPVPKWHEKDGGRYIGTGCAVITRDPDSGAVNLGTYRVMAHDGKTVDLQIKPGGHGWVHRQKYHARGEPCPMAVSVGHHPLIFQAACAPLPEGAEYQYIGAIRGEPVEVVEEEITGLPIPADSEIVIAGYCPPGKTRMEGPFGEFTGYYAGEQKEEPIIEVERVYYRNDPIILGSPPGRPPSDFSYNQNLWYSALLQRRLENIGLPDVKAVWFNEAVGAFLLTVSIKQRYAGHAKQAGLLASQLAGVGVTIVRYVIVVDEDIDVTDIRDVLWALCTRSDPDKDIDIIRGLPSTRLDPMTRKPATAFFASRAIIDACKPYEWINEFPEVIDFSPEIVGRVQEKWGTVLGY